MIGLELVLVLKETEHLCVIKKRIEATKPLTVRSEIVEPTNKDKYLVVILYIKLSSGPSE